MKTIGCCCVAVAVLFVLADRALVTNGQNSAGRFGAYDVRAFGANGLEMRDVEVSFVKDEQRPVVVLDDVAGAYFDNLKAKRTAGVPFFVLRKVGDFSVRNATGVADLRRAVVVQEKY